MLHTGYLTRGGDSGRVVSPPRDFPLVDARLSLDITLHYLSAPIKPSNFRRRRETLSEEGKETFVRYPPGSALLDNKKWNGGGDWLRSFHLFHLPSFFFSFLLPQPVLPYFIRATSPQEPEICSRRLPKNRWHRNDAHLISGQQMLLNVSSMPMFFSSLLFEFQCVQGRCILFFFFFFVERLSQSINRCELNRKGMKELER